VLQTIRRAEKDTVLVPAYHCPVVVEAVLKAGMQPRFYNIGADLSPEPSDILSKWDHDVAAIIAVNHFGFPFNMNSIAPELRQTAFVIEDCSHSFLYSNPLRLSGGRGDASIYSFWKIVPCMVGGGLAIRSEELRSTMPDRTLPLVESLRITKRLFEEALDDLERNPVRRVRNLSQKHQEPKLSTGQGLPDAQDTSSEDVDIYQLDPALNMATMPWLSRRVLAAADLRAIVESRRNNFMLYHNGIKESVRVRKVFQTLPEQVCPWVFPIIFEGRQRESLDYHLRAQGVLLHTFGSTLHPAFATCSEIEMVRNTRFLADNLVCLSVHQNIRQSDIAASCEKINALLKSYA
jgi:dTDP-4-amino-4,6-dideoxygalactose transaminase